MKHRCHWPECPKEVPPKMWGCSAHWFKLPPFLRSLIWKEYRPGQEISKTPSAAYIATAKAVQAWIHFDAQGQGQEFLTKLRAALMAPAPDPK